MKSFLTFLFALVLSTSAYATSSCDQMVAYGYPQTSVPLESTQLCRIAYTVSHNDKRKTPIYSAELLLKENSSGTNKRINAFKADPDLQPGQRAELSDYNKEYDRGHMTPFEDTKENSAAALQTFYLSNMAPQNLHLNRGLWRTIENHVRIYAAKSQSGVYVITGPIYDGSPITIGNGVAVPSRFFKVVIDKVTNQGIAYIVPNISPVAGVSYSTYAVPISDVEKVVGINFTPSLVDGSFKQVIGAEFK